MTNSNFELYSIVQLSKPLPDYDFTKGDVATVVEIVQDTKGNYGYVLEFFDSSGKTLDVVVAPEDFLMKPIEHGVVNYRPYRSS